MSLKPSRAKRALAYALVHAIVWMQMVPVALAATDLADVPLATKGRAKPNMILVVDDSGSMDFEFLPTKGATTNDGNLWWNTASRSFIGYGATSTANTWQGGGTDPTGTLGGTGFFSATPPTGPLNFNFSGVQDSTWKKYVYLFPNGYCGGSCDTRSYSDGGDGLFPIAPTREFGWTRSPLYNAQYYNPAINYDPWRPYNTGSGSSLTLPNYDGTAGLHTAVRSHPIYPTSGAASTMNLTTTVPKPATDAAAASYLFILYSGMIMPANSRYRICAQNGTGCGTWTNGSATDDVCLVPAAADTASYCHFAGTYGVTSTLAVGSSGAPALPKRVEAQIAYDPAVVWILSTATGALGANEAYGPDGRRLQRITISSATTSYTKASTRTDCAGASCTYQEEMTNFANWFAYHRKRHMMLNGALGLAFDQLTGLRAGYFLFNNRVNVTMRDFDDASDTLNAKRLLNDLYRTKGNSGTPTRRSIEYAGQQFQRTDASAPVQAACQSNAAFVITDGFATTEGPASTYGNQDGNTTNRFATQYSTTNTALNYTTATPAGLVATPPTDPAISTVTVTPQMPYADGESETMGDVAMYYYRNNLRSDLAKRQVPIEIRNENADSDRNDYVHMNTYALGLGVQGEVFGRTDTTTLTQINQNPYNTALTWSWPSVYSGTSYKDRHPAAIDELWHATLNGRGLMLSASSPEETRAGVVDIVNSVGAKGGSGAAVAVANPNVVPGDNFSYASSYNSGPWSGDLNKYEISTSTGDVSTTALWSPSPQKQLAVRPPSNRLIATYDGSDGIPFEWSNLTSTQQAALTATVSGVTISGELVLNFLRGDRSLEVEKFRTRGPRPTIDAATGSYVISDGKYVYTNNRTPDDISILGDIVNSEPVVVRGPKFSYFDDGYLDFKTTYANRSGVVYQGANDGMLHAFDVSTGAELWSYVPNAVFTNLRTLSDRYSYRHLYYVDGTPTVGDVDFSVTGDPVPADPADPNWHTILVGGLRKGGFGYYALDITTPTASTETTVASKVLWEFPNASTSATVTPNIGYSYGKPLVVKTRAAGWVVLVTTGYNNGTGTGSSGGDGIGRVIVLNPTDGSVIATLSTGAGTTTAPSGLAHLSAFSQRPDLDPTIEAAYGGDLLGNVWRFDLSGATTSSWTVGLLARLRSSTGDIQPVTTEPELGMIQNKRVIYVGAGQYLGDTDVPTTATPPAGSMSARTMSFYALRDDLSTTSTSTPQISGRGVMVSQTVTKSTSTLDITTNAVDFASASGWGWYLDLPDAGERLVTHPVLSGGAIVFTTNIPNSTDPCNPGGSSWLYFIDYATGGRISGATNAGKRLGSFLASRPVLIRLPSGQIVALIRTSTASTVKENVQSRPSAASGRRLSWREIPDTGSE
ncbi:MAG: PilC/PilY family type IV pilus protein [Burkholderiales bacterium]